MFSLLLAVVFGVVVVIGIAVALAVRLFYEFENDEEFREF